jgi:hypothetical protein
MDDKKEARKILRTKLQDKLIKIKTLLHSRVVIEIGKIEDLVDSCLSELRGKK